MYDCPECNNDLDLSGSNIWNYVGVNFECQHCKTLLIIYADCSYDPESGDECLWFFVERV